MFGAPRYVASICSPQVRWLQLRQTVGVVRGLAIPPLSVGSVVPRHYTRDECGSVCLPVAGTVQDSTPSSGLSSARAFRFTETHLWVSAMVGGARSRETLHHWTCPMSEEFSPVEAPSLVLVVQIPTALLTVSVAYLRRSSGRVWRPSSSLAVRTPSAWRESSLTQVFR